MKAVASLHDRQMKQLFGGSGSGSGGSGNTYYCYCDYAPSSGWYFTGALGDAIPTLDAKCGKGAPGGCRFFSKN
jgi:hypothetical protein